MMQEIKRINTYTKKDLKKYVTKENFNILMAIQPMTFVKDLDDRITVKMTAEYLNVSSTYVNDLIRNNFKAFKEYGLIIFDKELAQKLEEEKKVEYNKGFYKYINSNISLKQDSSRLLNKKCFLYLILISNCKIATKLREIIFDMDNKKKNNMKLKVNEHNNIDTNYNKENITKIIGEQNKEIQRLKEILRQSIPLEDIDEFIEIRA